MICHEGETLFFGPPVGGDLGLGVWGCRDPAIFKCMGWWGWGQWGLGIGDRRLQNCPLANCAWFGPAGCLEVLNL
jgi:hypothetical protein